YLSFADKLKIFEKACGPRNAYNYSGDESVETDKCKRQTEQENARQPVGYRMRDGKLPLYA
ncbi:MAG: hypothetical protein MJZ12_10620, partial [Prevotella sp.]|nr:hypothetical protein [Prevotella sp.]